MTPFAMLWLKESWNVDGTIAWKFSTQNLFKAFQEAAVQRT